jgi:hypothetical protein
MNEVVDILDRIFQAQNLDYSGLTVEAISKDPIRKEKLEKRSKYPKDYDDPLYSYPPESSWSRQSPSASQSARAKKYADLKRVKLDTNIEKEKQQLKTQLNNIIDNVIDKVIADVKAGRVYSVDKVGVAQKIASTLNLNNIQRLAKAYNTTETKYSMKHAADIARELKKSNLL